jgi:hypothetical protein
MLLSGRPSCSLCCPLLEVPRQEGLRLPQEATHKVLDPIASSSSYVIYVTVTALLRRRDSIDIAISCIDVYRLLLLLLLITASRRVATA